MASLEGWNFTIKLCPRVAGKLPRVVKPAKRFLGWLRSSLAILELGA
jgi:hypothetical protein